MSWSDFARGVREAAKKVRELALTETGNEPSSIFQIVRAAGNTAGFIAPQEYRVPGDTVYCSELNTSAPMYLRLGSSLNPWIRLVKGATYHRNFTRIWIRTTERADHPAFISFPVDFTLYVSTGELYRPPPDPGGGLVRGAHAWEGTVPAGNYLNPLDDINVTSRDVKTTGKVGRGTLAIQNRGYFGDIVLNYSATGGAVGYHIGPGETFTMAIDSRIQSSVTGFSGPGDRITLTSSTGAPVPYAALLSALEFDRADVTQPAGDTA